MRSRHIFTLSCTGRCQEAPAGWGKADFADDLQHFCDHSHGDGAKGLTEAGSRWNSSLYMKDTPSLDRPRMPCTKYTASSNLCLYSGMTCLPACATQEGLKCATVCEACAQDAFRHQRYRVRPVLHAIQENRAGRHTHGDGHKLWGWFQATQELGLVHASDKACGFCISGQTTAFHVEVCVRLLR